MARRRTRRKLSLTRTQKLVSLVCAAILAVAAGAAALTRYGGRIVEALDLPGSLQAEGGDLEIHILDVGNADSILVTKDGESLLIDAAENQSADTVVAYLHSQGIARLNYVIATHADADHIGGMDEVVNTFPIDTFIMAAMPEEATPTTKTYRKLLDALDAQGQTITEAEPGQTFPLGGAVLSILGPAGEFDDTNEMSVVCRVDFGSCGFLFMGDAEKEAEDALLASGANLRADFLKVGHHGSNSSTQERLLAAVRPTYAAITCGAGNPYGHPSPETLEALEEYGVQVYRCDLDGRIDLTCDGETVTVSTEK
ncbi:MAG TPA: MBL fold metallo-hydrolase [Firmicutes bacterium]|nr:MBL fold metallo-hydrolase [Bacillota bacterium]